VLVIGEGQESETGGVPLTAKGSDGRAVEGDIIGAEFDGRGGAWTMDLTPVYAGQGAQRVRRTVVHLLPRIVVVMEDLLDAEWGAIREKWLPLMGELLANGHKTGIHLILIARTRDSKDIPESLLLASPTQVILRSASVDIERLLLKTASVPVNFVDAFLLEGERGSTPLESCKVTDSEIERVVMYWRQAAALRGREVPSPVSTGVIGLLSPAVLANENGEADLPARSPAPTPQALKRITEALTPEEVKIARARALAAYLGWLGNGPLRDIMGMGADEAQYILARLREAGYLEAGDGPTWRFVRLDSE
jgi:hypothetical protein